MNTAFQSLSLGHPPSKPLFDIVCDFRSSFLLRLWYNVRSWKLFAGAANGQYITLCRESWEAYIVTPMTAASWTSG